MSPAIPEQQTTDLREYVQVLRARKWQILIVTLLFVAGALGYAFTATPTYRGTARVLVNPVLTAPSQVQAPQPPNMDNERAVATSPVIAERAATITHSTASAHSLQSHLNVTAATDTNVLQFAYESTSPRTAAKLANAFANAYVQFRIQQAVAVFTGTLRSVEAQITQAQNRITNLDSKIPTASPQSRPGLQARRDTALSRLTILQQRLSDVQGGQSTNQNAAQIVGKASVPHSPASPNKVKDGVLGLVAGLIVGIAIAFVRERFDDRVKGAEEMERRVGAPVLAAIPHVKAWRSMDQAQLVMVTDPKSPIAEAYRTLGTNLRYAASRTPLKVLMVTSSLGGEGKTTTSSNLAVALSRSGKRVILVSADIRRPRVHTFFGLENERGLSDALQDSTQLFELVKNPGMENLRIVTAGPVPDDPAELLASTHAAQVMDALRQVSDFVIVDTPPVLAVADASILSGLADGTIVVMDAEHSSRAAVTRAKYQLENAGANIVGVVYNNFDPQGPGGYYGSNYYYYQYYGLPESEKGVKTRRFRVGRRSQSPPNGFGSNGEPQGKRRAGAEDHSS